MDRKLRCGINIDPMNGKGRPAVQELQELGAEWVRFTFKDFNEGGSPSQFPFYDQVVQQLNGAGIRILLILSYETLPGKPGQNAQNATWDAYIERFAARCGQIAAHYGGAVSAYQVWNEPDFHEPRPDYDPTVRPQVFGRMLQACHKAIKAVSPALVVAGGLVAGQPDWLNKVREAAPGGQLFADAVGVHPYGRRPEPDWPRPGWGFGTLDELLQRYYDAARLPLWITELGTTSDQEDFPDRAFQALNRITPDQVSHAFWFCWSDGMVGNFGLLDDMGKKKPAYQSFQRFASLASAPELAKEEQLVGIIIPEIGEAAGDADALRAALLAATEAQPRVHLNPQAALQRRMLADGYLPSGNEFDAEVAGTLYRAQRGDDLRSGKARIYYARVPEWHIVDFISRSGSGQPRWTPQQRDIGFVERRDAATRGMSGPRIDRWAGEFNISVKSLTERPDIPQGDVVYVVKDIFTTRDGSWEPSQTPGSLPQWARDLYLKPWNADDYFDDAGADHHLFALVLDENGRPIKRKGVIFWSDGLAKLGDPLYRGYTMRESKEGSGWANIPISEGSHYNPERDRVGGPWCWCPIGASDVVMGGGMPYKWHVSTFVVWQAVPRQGAGEPPEGEEPEQPDLPPGATDVEAIRQAAWQKLGLPYAADSSLVRYARQHDLGRPLTGEFAQGGLRVQGFANGIVYAAIGDWDHVTHVDW